MSVPPVRFPSASRFPAVPSHDALTFDTTVSASSSGPVLPASYFVRDSEQISIWGFTYPPRTAEGLSVFPVGWTAETIPETQDIPETPDVIQSSDVSQDFEVIIPCKTLTADLRPYRTYSSGISPRWSLSNRVCQGRLWIAITLCFAYTIVNSVLQNNYTSA